MSLDAPAVTGTVVASTATSPYSRITLTWNPVFGRYELWYVVMPLACDGATRLLTTGDDAEQLTACMARITALLADYRRACTEMPGVGAIINAVIGWAVPA